MSIQQNFPAISPSLSLNFARSKTLDPRITFTRTSSGTRTNETGLVEVVPANSPRFDHSYDPVSGSVRSLGLLVEEQRVNYETNTEDPTQWITLNMIPTGNSVVLPTGEVSTTIEYKGETTDANNKLIRPTVSGTSFDAGDTWVYSGFYKKGVTNGERYIHIVLQNNTASESTGRRFDFDTGTWASSQSLNNVTVADSGYVVYPNGWYRIWMSCTFPSASGDVKTFTRLFVNSTSIPYDTSFSLWGAQLEKASFMTSYIPNNTGSQITRTPDNVSMVGENFSSWYNQEQGSFLWIGNVYSREISPVQPFRVNQGANLRGLGIQFDTRSINNSTNFASRTQSSNIPSKIAPSGIIPSDNKIKIAGGYIESVGLSTIRAAFNGLPEDSYSGYTQTDITYDTMNELEIMGNRGITGTNYQFTGVCEQLVYYPRILSDDQLQNLTK